MHTFGWDILSFILLFFFANIWLGVKDEENCAGYKTYLCDNPKCSKSLLHVLPPIQPPRDRPGGWIVKQQIWESIAPFLQTYSSELPWRLLKLAVTDFSCPQGITVCICIIFQSTNEKNWNICLKRERTISGLVVIVLCCCFYSISYYVLKRHVLHCTPK